MRKRKWDRRRRDQRVPEWYWIACMLLVALAAVHLEG